MDVKEIDKKTVEAPGGEVDAVAVETPRGRAGVLAKFQKANPDFEGDPTDEDLWNYAGEDYDSLKGNHKKLTESMSGFNGYVSKDPRFGAAVGMSFGDGDDKIPFMQALGRMYGPDAFNDSEEFIQGVKEFNEKADRTKQEQATADKNFMELTVPRLIQVAEENALSDEEFEAVKDGLFALGESMLMGDISLELIELIAKGITADRKIQEAADTGFVEGKGENVRAEIKKKTTNAPIPDLAGGTGAGKNRTRPQKEKGSYYDSMEEVKS